MAQKMTLKKLIRCKACRQKVQMFVAEVPATIGIPYLLHEPIKVFLKLDCPQCHHIDDYYVSVESNLDMGYFSLHHTWSIDTKFGALNNAVDEYIMDSTERFNETFEASALPVIKYIHPQYLEKFLANQRLNISRTEGYTWGDGVYVTPVKHVTSSIMYGRCGVLGLIKNPRELKIFDATQQRGLELYQKWIQNKKHLYHLLTTTVHAPYANRELRNIFKQQYHIDLVQFAPDERHSKFSASDDQWYVLSDWDKNNVYSRKVQSCKWMMLVGEEFKKNGLGFESFFDKWTRSAYSGSNTIQNYVIVTGATSRREFVAECLSAYQNDKILVVIP